MRLNRTDVLEAAMTLLDAEGLERLTMRRLATSLKVQPGALYWHFADKQALLDAMAERLLADVGQVDPPGSWDQQVATLAQQVRAALLSHRDGARLLAGTFVAQPNTMRTGEAFLRALRAAGVPDGETGMTSFALLYYILGHTIEEQARDELVATGGWQQQLDELDGVGFPDIARELTSMDSSTGDQRFQHGLGLFLDGIRHQLAARSDS
ncbi:TetR/AcrR family transcriptional regulator C-terminal domain-containing protein [Streptacidiphilus sp. PAMC 29251]